VNIELARLSPLYLAFREEPVTLLEHYNDNNAQHQPGGVDWANQDEWRLGQGRELEVEHDSEENERNRWQDDMPAKRELLAVFT